jgi:hypothetical protein
MDALMISHELKSTLGLTFASSTKGKAVVMAVADHANGFRYSHVTMTITTTTTITITITIITSTTIISVGDVIKTVGSSEVDSVKSFSLAESKLKALSTVQVIVSRDGIRTHTHTHIHTHTHARAHTQVAKWR